MTPHGTLSRVRVLVADGTLHAFDVDADRRPVEVARVQVAAYPPDAGVSVLRFTTVDGEEWVVAPDSGCGCGHPLKRTNASVLLALVAP